jgi:hypothetical protein
MLELVGGFAANQFKHSPNEVKYPTEFIKTKRRHPQ